MRRVGEFIREFHAEVNGQRRGAELTTGLKRRELDEVQRKLDGLIEAMGRLLPGAAIAVGTRRARTAQGSTRRRH